MKMIIVGDPHVKSEDIDDCESLLEGVLSTAKETDTTTVLFLGDLFHNHSIVHLTVLSFWQKWFKRFVSEKITVIALKGNHDFGLSNPDHHALEPFKELAIIVDHPVDDLCYPQHKALFMPYFGPRRSEDFYEVVKKNNDIVFCHETFSGAKYDNGFFAPDGFDQDLVNAPYIISGHIHSGSTLIGKKNKVFYPGSPRWMTASDSNKNKAIYLLNTNSGDVEFTPFDTSKWCQKIESIEICSVKDLERELGANIKPKARTTTTLILKGSRAEVENLLQLVKDKGFLIKQSILKDDISVKESLGVKESYIKFLTERLDGMGYDKESSSRLVNRSQEWMI
jgi:DNA repair exonuclease SbcCD nuclease subunit